MRDIPHHTNYRQMLAVNAELLGLCWDIGRQLDAWQRERAWGSAVVAQISVRF